MKLALCIIVEGDIKLEALKKATESCAHVFDGVYITANHKPCSGVEALCSEKGYHFSYLEWNDNFSEQRNFNFSQAKDYDYIVWMDSDDVILNPEMLRDIATVAKQSEYDAVFFEYWYGAKFDGEPSIETFVEVELNQKRERMLNPRKITWKKRVHETPVPIDGKNYRYTTITHSKDYPIAWLHLGADRDMPQEVMDARMNRNRRLLELELADERKEGEADPRTILYLMKIYAEYEDEVTLYTCIDLGKEYLLKSGWDQERAMCYALMSRCIGKLGKDGEARDFLHSALKEYPYDPLLYLYLARAYFNLGDYRAMKHWMQIGLNYDLDKSNTTMNNVLEMKLLAAELMTEFYLRGERDIRKAYQSAQLVTKINPSKENQENERVLRDQSELDQASEHAHKFMDYLKSKALESHIPYVVAAMSDEMAKLPFAIKYNNRFKSPRVWGEDEICYFASFGNAHFEKWSGKSLQKGIGGSETAVIRLAEEWVKLGYKVTVYGDPEEEGLHNGVLYLPYYKFNQRDKFNIFIQWRSSHMADKISAKKYLIDLHDVFFGATHMDKVNQIDKFFVKSKYHKGLGNDLPDKFEVVSNGI